MKKAYALRHKTFGTYYTRRGNQKTPALWSSRKGACNAKCHTRWPASQIEVVEFNLTPSDGVTLGLAADEAEHLRHLVPSLATRIREQL